MSALACRTGRHAWTRPADAERCCNGYRRELRLDALDFDDDPARAVPVAGLSVPAWWVWVPAHATKGEAPC